MAIDTANKRRNVCNMALIGVMGLIPNGVMAVEDRVNAGRSYIGFEYGSIEDATPENINLITTITINVNLDTVVA